MNKRKSVAFVPSSQLPAAEAEAQAKIHADEPKAKRANTRPKATKKTKKTMVAKDATAVAGSIDGSIDTSLTSDPQPSKSLPSRPSTSKPQPISEAQLLEVFSVESFMTGLFEDAKICKCCRVKADKPLEYHEGCSKRICAKCLASTGNHFGCEFKECFVCGKRGHYSREMQECVGADTYQPPNSSIGCGKWFCRQHMGIDVKKEEGKAEYLRQGDRLWCPTCLPKAKCHMCGSIPSWLCDCEEPICNKCSSNDCPENDVSDDDNE